MTTPLATKADIDELLASLNTLQCQIDELLNTASGGLAPRDLMDIRVVTTLALLSAQDRLKALRSTMSFPTGGLTCDGLDAIKGEIADQLTRVILRLGVNG